MNKFREMFKKTRFAAGSHGIQQDPESPFGGSAAAPVCGAESGCRALLMASARDEGDTGEASDDSGFEMELIRMPVRGTPQPHAQLGSRTAGRTGFRTRPSSTAHGFSQPPPAHLPGGCSSPGSPGSPFSLDLPRSTLGNPAPGRGADPTGVPASRDGHPSSIAEGGLPSTPAPQLLGLRPLQVPSQHEPVDARAGQHASPGSPFLLDLLKATPAGPAGCAPSAEGTSPANRHARVAGSPRFKSPCDPLERQLQLHDLERLQSSPRLDLFKLAEEEGADGAMRSAAVANELVIMGALEDEDPQDAQDRLCTRPRFDSLVRGNECYYTRPILSD